ncbi:hypothetical protein HBI56_051090 [Parastagonospora nodorum]|nr:hypothetical protein HBH56_241630 [Parastagonospora nodorum]KAH3930594.1 hypothetical protein HBH54_115390 [Parastagonospora nodorum]KAH3942944.1 hypothetical protein HBH53_180390 [Parastagonospora nodorum]KAH3964527.1 hypothetical protein HBH51_156680 [Parastagonospora nodorum]KAH3981262.1 hypothetical protein HBH52_088940 [Parastagonospora nodorum]
MESTTTTFSLFAVRTVFCCVVLAVFLAVFSARKPKSNLPWVALDEDPTTKGLQNVGKARRQWVENCNAVIDKGLSEVKGAFWVQTDVGPKIILPNSYAEEIRNSPHMVFSEAIKEELLATYSGITPIGLLTDGHVFQDLTRINLTRSLDAVTPILNGETRVSLQKLLGDSKEWRETPIRNFANDLIVRLSTRVFFGSELCQNQEYLDHIVTWGNLVLMVNAALRPWPLALRKIVHMFHPFSRQIRSTRMKIRSIISPLIAERVALKKQGKTSAKMSDMVGWMEDIIEEKGANVDLIDGQLFIAFAAVETTSTTLAYLILDLLDHPEAVAPLRQEIIEVLGSSGWSKTSLMRLKLLDSAMKESQRLHPLSHLNMQRKVIQNVTLSDGTVLPKGTQTFVRWETRSSESVYPNPDEFVVDRFLKMRESGENGASSKWQFVSTSPEHLAFGHGRQACPGRFFASNEMKVAMVHILLKYEWKYTGEGRKPEQTISHIPMLPFDQKVAFRRREVEAGLDL